MFALFLWCLFFLWLGAIYNELLLVFCFLIEMSTQRCTVSQVLGKKKRPQSPKSPCCRALKIVCSELCLSRIINYRISSVLIKCQKKLVKSTRRGNLIWPWLCAKIENKTAENSMPLIPFVVVYDYCHASWHFMILFSNLKSIMWPVSVNKSCKQSCYQLTPIHLMSR